MQMRFKSGVIGILFLGLAFALPGCGGGGAKSYYYNRNTTIGQELSDLQTAFQRGAITEQEYRQQREKILQPEQD